MYRYRKTKNIYELIENQGFNCFFFFDFIFQDFLPADVIDI